MTPHELDIERWGECTTCGSRDLDDVCAMPRWECAECGAFAQINADDLCETCADELGGEA